MEIEYLKDDATQPKADNGNAILLIHCCNDIGAWGAGFVLAINKRWSTPEAHYRDWSVGRSPGVNPPFALGNVQVVQVEQRLFIGNMIGQHGIGPDAEIAGDAQHCDYDQTNRRLAHAMCLRGRDLSERLRFAGCGGHPPIRPGQDAHQTGGWALPCGPGERRSRPGRLAGVA